jgi:hypothetical protein
MFVHNYKFYIHITYTGILVRPYLRIIKFSILLVIIASPEYYFLLPWYKIM